MPGNYLCADSTCGHMKNHGSIFLHHGTEEKLKRKMTWITYVCIIHLFPKYSVTVSIYCSIQCCGHNFLPTHRKTDHVCVRHLSRRLCVTPQCVKARSNFEPAIFSKISVKPLKRVVTHPLPAWQQKGLHMLQTPHVVLTRWHPPTILKFSIKVHVFACLSFHTRSTSNGSHCGNAKRRR